MRVCALVGASDFNEQHFLEQHFDYIVAVDAGYAHLERIGVKPDAVIGDFDSLGYVPKHSHLKKLPTRKDKSDIEVALEEVEQSGFDLILVYGCLGGRIDFTFAMYQLLAHFSRGDAILYAIGLDSVVCTLDEKGRNAISFNAGAQGLLSLFAFSHEVRGVNESGLEYALDNATLRNDEPLGVSNAFTGRVARVSIVSGTALLFFPIVALGEVFVP
ncbi:MAG: thiamine diphosphokinase [Raoultibacter sp.]